MIDYKHLISKASPRSARMVDEHLIYDVGAHKGEDTEFYLKKGFRVVAIEAAPALCELLKQRFWRAIQDGQLNILNVAVSEASGPIDFYINEAFSVWGTTKPDWVRRNKLKGAGKTRKIRVEARPLWDIIDEHGIPRYCKIDVEGSDLDALKSLIGAKGAPQYISIESESCDWKMLMEEFLTFRELGYSRYKIVDQTLINLLQTCSRPAREGSDCDHVFQYGSSGLFGEELPGAWLTPQEAIEAYRNIFRGLALNGEYGMFTGKLSLFRMLGRIQAIVTYFKGSGRIVTAGRMLPPPAWYDTHAAK